MSAKTVAGSGHDNDLAVVAELWWHVGIDVMYFRAVDGVYVPSNGSRPSYVWLSTYFWMVSPLLTEAFDRAGNTASLPRPTGKVRGKVARDIVTEAGM